MTTDWNLMEEKDSWKRRTKRKWEKGIAYDFVEIRNPNSRRWEIVEKTELTYDYSVEEWVPVGMTKADIAAREEQARQKEIKRLEQLAFQEAKQHQARIDLGVSSMTDVEYAIFSQLDDIKVLLGGIRSDSKFAERIRVAPQFGMGISYLQGISHLESENEENEKT